MMKMLFVPTYVCEDGTVIQFFKHENLPGFSHRVVIKTPGEQTIDWLGDHIKPGKTVAEYFYEKHRLNFGRGTGRPI